MNSKLHAVCDGLGRPVIMLLSESQMSDFKGAALMLSSLPKAKELLGDKGYDADWFRDALAKKGISACIPSKSNRKIQIEHDRDLYRQRHKVENMFGRLKEATVKRYFYQTHDELRSHLADFVTAYNFARRLKTLKGLTPYEYICRLWTKEPQRFILDPLQQMPGLNI